MNDKVGVFVGRMCPIHIGHMETINTMVRECGEDNSIIILGSMVQNLTFRVMFPYYQRRNWIRTLYKRDIRIVGVPDFPNNNEAWLSAIDDILDSSFRHSGYECMDETFYGGSVKDLEYFHSRGRKIRVVDRTSIPVSATVIRDLLLRGQSISGFVDRRIEVDVVNKFNKAIQDL